MIRPLPSLIDPDRPVGPTLNCLSPAKVVDAMKNGPTQEQVAHLSVCEPCKAWLERATKLSKLVTT
jgi:hypothetical protein